MPKIGYRRPKNPYGYSKGAYLFANYSNPNNSANMTPNAGSNPQAFGPSQGVYNNIVQNPPKLTGADYDITKNNANIFMNQRKNRYQDLSKRLGIDTSKVFESEMRAYYSHMGLDYDRDVLGMK